MPRINPQFTDWMYQWGDWNRAPAKRLGYPSMTQEARLLASPGRSSTVDYTPEIKLSPIARFVETQLASIQPAMKTLLWWQYTQQAPIGRIAEYLGRTIGETKWQVEQARREGAKALGISLYVR